MSGGERWPECLVVRGGHIFIALTDPFYGLVYFLPLL